MKLRLTMLAFPVINRLKYAAGALAWLLCQGTRTLTVNGKFFFIDHS